MTTRDKSLAKVVGNPDHYGPGHYVLTAEYIEELALFGPQLEDELEAQIEARIQRECDLQAISDISRCLYGIGIDDDTIARFERHEEHAA